MTQLLLIAGVIILSAGVVFAFRNASSGAAFSYMGLTSIYGSKISYINAGLVCFWALAVLIVLFVNIWRQHKLQIPNVGRNFIVGGALVGMVAGLVLGYAAMVVGSALGVCLGTMAWWRTPSGIACQQKFVRVLAEVGLPAVVTMSVAGVALSALVAR